MQKTIEQVLAEEGSVFFQTSGDSMEPLLTHRKRTVVIQAPAYQLKSCVVVL